MGTIRNENVALKTGERFTVTFNEMASAGYLWSCTVKPNALEITSVCALPDNDGRVGGSIKKTFSALCKQSGTFEFEFQYKRPWNSEAAETVRYVLQVQTKDHN